MFCLAPRKSLSFRGLSVKEKRIDRHGGVGTAIALRRSWAQGSRRPPTGVPKRLPDDGDGGELGEHLPLFAPGDVHHYRHVDGAVGGGGESV